MPRPKFITAECFFFEKLHLDFVKFVQSLYCIIEFFQAD